jgi:predicted CopG family antitoxin
MVHHDAFCNTSLHHLCYYSNMRTTITLDDDVIKTIREEMKEGDGKSFKEAVNELIRLGRFHKKEVSEAMAVRKPFKVRSKNMGIYPHLNYDRTSDLLAMLDEEEYREKTEKLLENK